MSARLACSQPPARHVTLGVRALLLAAATAGCIGSVSDPLGSSGSGAPPPGKPGAVGPGVLPTTPDPVGCTSQAPLASRIWKLGDDQWANAVADLLPGVTVPEIATPGMSKAAFVNVDGLYPVTGAL